MKLYRSAFLPAAAWCLQILLCGVFSRVARKNTTQLRNKVPLISALVLLAALLIATPAQARAAGAVLCGDSAARTDRAPRAQESTPQHAGLVIDFGDGRVMTFCIDLGADGQATGEELLRASNLPVIFEYNGGIGGAVCKIDTVGSDFPSEPCFSRCTLRPGEPCLYWSYSQLVGDHWQYSQVGASNIVVHSGEVNGWAWGESTTARGAQPPLRTLAEICLPATATPTATLTLTPSASPTATLPPTAAPPPTTSPYVARVITSTPTTSPTPTSAPTTATSLPSVASPVPAISASPEGSPPAQPATPTALLESSSTVPLPPAATPSATALPSATSAAPATVATASSSIGGSLRIRLPLIQRSVAASPGATPALPSASPTTQVESAPVARLGATPASVIATPTPARSVAAGDDPARNYPYFGGMSALLLASWALLRRGRPRRAP